MRFHGSVICVTVCHVPNMLFKAMLGSFRTTAQIQRIILPAFAKDSLEYSGNLLERWEILT